MSTITANFNAGSTTSRVNVPVFTDRIVEGPERFGLTIRSNVSRITTGSRSSAVGVITDSTSLLLNVLTNILLTHYGTQLLVYNSLVPRILGLKHQVL